MRFRRRLDLLHIRDLQDKLPIRRDLYRTDLHDHGWVFRGVLR
jgi:hypothetical protein